MIILYQLYYELDFRWFMFIIHDSSVLVSTLQLLLCILHRYLFIHCSFTMYSTSVLVYTLQLHYVFYMIASFCIFIVPCGTVIYICSVPTYILTYMCLRTLTLPLVIKRNNIYLNDSVLVIYLNHSLQLRFAQSCLCSLSSSFGILIMYNQPCIIFLNFVKIGFGTAFVNISAS